jgi:hypothetical protein
MGAASRWRRARSTGCRAVKLLCSDRDVGPNICVSTNHEPLCTAAGQVLDLLGARRDAIICREIGLAGTPAASPSAFRVASARQRLAVTFGRFSLRTVISSNDYFRAALLPCAACSAVSSDLFEPHQCDRASYFGCVRKSPEQLFS